jgi:hypothetical protein
MSPVAHVFVAGLALTSRALALTSRELASIFRPNPLRR